MKTRIIRVSPSVVDPDKMDEIVKVLRSGGIIVYPTETFYGLGANVFSEKAIKKVYRLKKRDPQKPLSVLISDLAMLSRIVSGVPDFFLQAVLELWPGPLTVILKASSEVPRVIQGQGGTLGVRLPGHKWVRSLLAWLNNPITATSANISGEVEISTPEEAIKLFEGLVDLVIDGGRTEGLLPSTVVDLSGKTPRLIREGAIPHDRLKKYLPSLIRTPL